ncbi:putative leader peptide [Streptomyces mexicanus]
MRLTAGHRSVRATLVARRHVDLCRYCSALCR